MVGKMGMGRTFKTPFYSQIEPAGSKLELFFSENRVGLGSIL
jgi:hypothetical protein